MSLAAQHSISSRGSSVGNISTTSAASLPHSVSEAAPPAASPVPDRHLNVYDGKSLPELLTDAMVDVYIGPERKKFHLHEDLLCARSTFFEKAFKGSFKEGSAKTMHLPDKHVALFELFVRWLYGATLCTPTTENVSHYVELYIMGETFCIESLKNHSMDLIRQGHRIKNWRWGPVIISMIYDNTSANSPLRDFFLRCTVWKVTQHSTLQSNLLDLLRQGGDFAAEFAIGLLALQNGTLINPQEEADCIFHQHEHTRRCGGVVEAKRTILPRSPTDLHLMVLRNANIAKPWR